MGYGLFIAILATIATRAYGVGIGGACSATALCTVSNSYCNRIFTAASCTNGACACHAGRSGSTCTTTVTLQGYNGACTTNSNCASGYTCTNSKCVCATATYTYRAVLGMCLAPAKKALGEACTQTSDCYNTGGATNGMTCASSLCACASGYLAKSGLCVQPYYGETCTATPGCRQRPVMYANSDSSRQTEVCPAAGGTCQCPTTADAVTVTMGAQSYTVCLQKTTTTLLADGATCTASNLCSSKICNSCMDGTSTLKCVRLVASSGDRTAVSTMGLFMTLVALAASMF